MKLPVTQKIVEDVLTEAHRAKRLQAGDWASVGAYDRGVAFRGCAVGNLLWEASGRRADDVDVLSAAEEVTGDGAIWSAPRHAAEAIRAEVAAGHHMNAASIIFEARYDGSDVGLARTLAGIRKYLPARFSIDIDGLRAIPTWRKKRKATKRKAVRK